MPGPKPKAGIESTTEEEQFLRKLVGAHKSPQENMLRAWILLLVFDHPKWTNQQIAKDVDCTDWTVCK